jgi:Zn-dependent protease with chaperone function
MTNKTWLIGIILGIPLIAFAVSEGIQVYHNSELHSAIQQQFTEIDPKVISQYSMDQLCESLGTKFSELQDICTINRHLNLMSTASVISGVVGLTLIITIFLAGFIARTNRWILLVFFKPGIYLTILVLIGLIAVYAIIAMAALYYGESILIGRVHFIIIGSIGIGALLGVGAMILSAFSLVKKAKTTVIGNIISQGQAPAIYQHVNEIADKLDALPPDNIVVGLDPNFFVTEADVSCLDGNISGRTLYCSLPLCRILSTEEFTAVIGHELGHYKGSDTKFSQKFFPIYRGVLSSIESLVEKGGEGARVIALLPAIAILSYFFECFAVAESRISRSRELTADQHGVTITNSKIVASALVKIHAFAVIWDVLQQTVIKTLQKGKSFVNISKTYADAVSNYATLEALNGIVETHLSHPTDSHPVLSKRLDALEICIKDVSKAALDVQPTKAAIEIFSVADKHEEDISEVYQAFLIQTLGMDLNDLECKEDLTALI